MWPTKTLKLNHTLETIQGIVSLSIYHSAEPMDVQQKFLEERSW